MTEPEQYTTMSTAHYPKVCPNCGERYPRWRRWCRAHVWKVRLMPVAVVRRLDADIRRCVQTIRDDAS